jgi:hypothetical protein
MSTDRGPGPGHPESFERVMVDVLLQTSTLHPDDVAGLITGAAESLGAWDPSLLVIDLDQRLLRPLATGRGGDTVVEGTLPGTAYRLQRVVDGGAVHGGRRLWVPVLDSAERVGVLGVSLSEPCNEVLDQFRALASLAGELIVTKSAYGDGIVRRQRSKEVSLAAELRWALLPPLTFTSSAIEISGILEPAYDIAGDTFDYAVNGDLAHVAVLDAMGHGLEASRIANLAVGSYRNSRRANRDLAAMLIEMDRVIAQEIGAHRFVTGQLATVDLDHGVLRMINAGHPPPLHFRGGVDIGDLPCTPCLPLGLGAVPTARAEVDLLPGDVVVFHTDGVPEARNASGDFFGRERLAASIEQSIGAGDLPAETLRSVVRDLNAFQNDRFSDDASLVLVSWQPAHR